MREIKFRAWHDEHKEMVNFDNKKASNDIYIACNMLKLMADNSPFLMQYTGLKDKNGVEIYEGDVVKSNSHKPTTFKIEFIEGGFCATRNDDDYPLDINHFYPSVGCMIEIIGNIYENPELLESK